MYIMRGGDGEMFLKINDKRIFHRKYNLSVTGEDLRMMLKWVFKKQLVREFSGFRWLRSVYTGPRTTDILRNEHNDHPMTPRHKNITFELFLRDIK
jgi:hypothetical protein